MSPVDEFTKAVMDMARECASKPKPKHYVVYWTAEDFAAAAERFGADPEYRAIALERANHDDEYRRIMTENGVIKDIGHG